MDKFKIKLFSLIDKTDSCWIWKGSKRYNGYGQIYFKNKMMIATRVMWYLTYGKFPSNFMCHKCDNKLCVKPDHLYDGTNAQNMNDMRLKYQKQRDEYNAINNPIISPYLVSKASK